MDEQSGNSNGLSRLHWLAMLVLVLSGPAIQLIQYGSSFNPKYRNRSAAPPCYDRPRTDSPIENSVTPMDQPERKPHGVGWYVAWGVLAMGVYAGSYGPYTFTGRYFDWDPQPVWNCLDVIYKPLGVMLRVSPAVGRGAFGDYVDYCGELGYRRERYAGAPPRCRIGLR